LREVRNILDGRESACNFDTVVVSCEEQVRPEVELLKRAVAGEVRTEPHLEAGEFEAILVDRFEFADRETRQRKQKRARQVGPQRIAVEIGALQRIPRGVQRVAGEGITWVRPFGDDAAVELFDR